MTTPAHGRQANLNPQYQAWYPGLRAGVWLPAWHVAETVDHQLAFGSPRWAPTDRLLSEEHFEFRGGTSRAPWIRTRAEDKRYRGAASS